MLRVWNLCEKCRYKHRGTRHSLFNVHSKLVVPLSWHYVANRVELTNYQANTFKSNLKNHEDEDMKT